MRDSNLTLEQLQLYNFKNYESLKLSFRGKVVCFTGDNGSGKTNVLDAIYYLSTTKSFISSLDTHAIRNGSEQASITAEYVRQQSPEQIILALRKAGKKSVKRNFKEYDKLADHIGMIPIVVISPYDIVLIWEGSEERRKFLDVCISQQDAKYLQHLLSYNHALAQRNNLLKIFGQKGGYNADALEPWDFQLMEHGTAIFEKRKVFISAFNDVFESVYAAIAGSDEQPGLVYESELLQCDFGSLLKMNRERDQHLERTSGGIHRDDLVFTINGLPIKKMASQGQQKSFLIALKLAQYQLMAKAQTFVPLLLLDDLFDKIDENRARSILQWTQHHVGGQIFMTDTHSERIPGLLSQLGMEHQHIHIRRGEVAQD